MPFKFWRKNERIKRPADKIKDQSTFDILQTELNSMIIVEKLDTIQLTYHAIYGTNLYDIVYKSPINCLFSIFRSQDKQDAISKFAHLSQILTVIHKELGLESRNLVLNAQTLENAVQFILKYKHWLPIHFAGKFRLVVDIDFIFSALYITARFGLANFFKQSDYLLHVEEFLNTQSNPLERSPIMLAILSSDFDTIKAILSLNPAVNQKDRRGNNLLHFAAVCPSRIWSLVFKYCVFNGYFNQLLSERNNKYVTPIHFICYSKNFENMVNLLKTGLMTIDLLTVEPPYVIKRQLRQQEATSQTKDQNPKTDKTEESIEELANNQSRTILFTDEMIADLKFEDMIYGGTPLHWCRYKRTLERLIEYNFNLNAYDLNHETASVKCIKDNRFKCLIILLNAGANLNLVDKKGNTSLHEAVLSKDVALVQACVCWDAKLDQKNKNGETPRHLASCRGTSDDQLIVHILHSVGASRCDMNMQDCRPDCAHKGLTNGKKYSKWPSFERESPYFPFLNQNIIREKLQDFPDSNDQVDTENESRKVKMICFDGGGTKGLISVQMLIEIEKLLKRPLNEYFKWMSGTSTGSLIAAMLSLNIPLRNIKVIYYMLKDKIMIGPRPYDSGLLECLLQGILGEDLKMGQLNKKVLITGTLADRKPCQLHLFRSYPSPNEILSLNKPSIENLLFGKKEEMITTNLDKMKSSNPHSIIIELSNLLSTYHSNNQNSNKKTQNESVENENDVKNEQVSFKDEVKRTKKLSTLDFHLNTTLYEFVESPNEIHSHNEALNSTRLKFYHIPNYLNQKLWLACRSSGAAPTFFRASGPFIDGGIISNNPVLDALTDFVNYNSALKQKDLNDSTSELDLVLSIGTGKPPVIPTEVIDIGSLYSLNFKEPYQTALQAFNLAQEMVTMATQTDAHVVQRGQAWCNSMGVPYFRFSPPLSENLQLNEVEEVEIVNALWETKAYMYSQRPFIEILVKLLEGHSVISSV